MKYAFLKPRSPKSYPLHVPHTARRRSHQATRFARRLGKRRPLEKSEKAQYYRSVHTPIPTNPRFNFANHKAASNFPHAKAWANLTRFGLQHACAQFHGENSEKPQHLLGWAVSKPGEPKFQFLTPKATSNPPREYLWANLA